MQDGSRHLGKLVERTHARTAQGRQLMQGSRPEHHKCLCCSQGTMSRSTKQPQTLP